MRFLREREKKLFQIRRNLAISTIGRTYRRLKLTFKSLKHRISKYKRRLRNSYIYDVPLLNSGISRKSSIEAGSNINGSAIDILELQNIPEPDENSSSTSGNERYQRELLLKKQQQERVEKVFFGKISHSIREKPSSPPLLPFLYQKDIIEGVSIPNNYCNITRATASRISESRPKRYSPSLIKSHTPTPQLRFKSKRIISKPVPLYKKQTFSSKMSRWDAEAEIEEIAPNKPKPKARTDSKVMDYTFTHRQKLNFKRTEIRLELTRPSTNLILQEKKVGKKSRSLRPYTMMSQNVEFNP